MCGITGIVRKRNSSLDIGSCLEKMSVAIKHRGPDDYAEFKDGSCGLAMRRLAILDLTPGLYPFMSDDGNLALVFNGEIYNFLELREELKAEGFEFRTNCDAEVILKGYQKWGNGVFSKLRGMFAVAIWDISQNKLILVRDRLGIKPIYYFDSPDFLLFSSEVKSFIALDRSLLNLRLDHENVELLLGFMFLPKSNETIVKGVKKVPPGTILELSNGKLSFEKYWELSDTLENKNISMQDATEQLDQLLSESVKIHLLSDAPLGVLLSGGVDSALITALMVKKRLSSAVSTYTAKFDHKFNESELAKDTANYLGTNHTEVEIDVSDLNKNLSKHIQAFDDLTTFDGGILSTKLLCSEIQKTGIKVLLLGEGADEVFGGYSWYGLSQKPFKFLPKIVRNAFYYYAISRNITFNFVNYVKFWNRAQSDSGDIFRDITKNEIELQLPNHLLMKVDKGSMTHSLEARVPYLDHKLVEFVYSLPSKYKIKGDWFNKSQSGEKYILREVAKKYLPENVANRKKRGFLLPMRDVLYADIGRVKQTLVAPDALSQQLLSKTRIEKLFSKNNELINMQNEYLMWRLYILETWASANNLKW